MFVIIGIVVVFGAMLAGYLMEHGNIKVLIQPAELVIIGGAAIGTVLIANPLHILKTIAGGVAGAFYHVLRVAMVSFMKGIPPTVAVEFARRVIPGHVRPSFRDLEKHIKSGGGAAAAGGAEAPAAEAAA